MQQSYVPNIGLPNYKTAFQDKEDRASNGNIIALACGPLTRPRYINPKIEAELVEFKKEIEDKFASSDVNKKFVFPRAVSSPRFPKPARGSHQLELTSTDYDSLPSQVSLNHSSRNANSSKYMDFKNS